MAHNPQWLDVAGLVNIRDFGGNLTTDGRTVRSGVALRSDNLDDLPSESIRHMVDDLHVSDIVDLRTNAERRGLTGFPFDGQVTVHRLSLYPEDGVDDPLPSLYRENLPLEPGDPHDRIHIVGAHYLGYFRNRPENIVAALRIVSCAPGATVINCAAGKDRTGIVSAVLLSALGVSRSDVLDDYAASTERIVAIMSKLGLLATTGSPERSPEVQAQTTPPELMELVLSRICRDFGSVNGWLEANGWMPDDQRAMEAKLLY